ncbi:MAG: DNA replication and repair protein RecF [Acidobacteriota bacterium]|nr:DNA replication and repair protein RecF [Blastocatellia bacterium]MDW8412464.1 DNA replication and repair protein RecF [Acidobacteriota bacterium]
MLIYELHAEGFRNLSGGMECSARTNLLYGENAQGKTAWLEAIYVLACTKSFRTSNLKEVISLASQRAVLRGEIGCGRITKQLQIQIDGGGKSIFVNSKRESLENYLGNLSVVAFSSQEMGIVRGEPSERRRFLDRGIVTLYPSYLSILAAYNNVIKQKNALLKTSLARNRLIEQIEIWNEQLVAYAAQIYSMRKKYTENLRQALEKRLFDARPVDVRYKPSLQSQGLTDEADEAEYATFLRQQLELRLESELASGHALIGPHRDELEIFVDGLEASRFASAGEQRSALLTLDLAQISVYSSRFGEYPVFLIDDIDAELDLRRIRLLLEHVEGKMQIFASTSKYTLAEMYRKRARCMTVLQGRVLNALQEKNSLLPATEPEEASLEKVSYGQHT